jgi:hypothetical protein
VRKPRSKLIAVTGVVIPTDWDEKGNAVDIAISSHDETEYFVDKKGKGPELLPLIRKEVEVRGVVREEENRKVITVRKFIIAERPAPEGVFPK